jgi:Na+-transporting NADH:ubiquinone oxidoreductase subunit B
VPFAFFQSQKMMRKVLIALLPISLFSVYLYGVSFILLSVFVFSGGIFTEWIMEKRMKKKVSEAVLVTCLLFTLSLPPRTPWWVALTGIVFGVFFAKEVYGGFGRNVFNPAIVSRLFVYLTFPNVMTTNWISPGFFGIDSVTTATPLAVLRQGGAVDSLSSFLGMRAGSMGESPVFLILIAAFFLIFTKTASWKIIASTFMSGFIFTFFLDIANVPGALPLLPALFSGSFLFATVFMATDPVTAPKKGKSLWVYGTIIGLTTVLIRTFSFFPEGVSFGILIANSFAPLIDLGFGKGTRKVKA